jgi:hypothetical protein
MKRKILFFLITAGMVSGFFIGSCSMPSEFGNDMKASESQSDRCPTCIDVPRVEDVTDPLNPEPENLASRAINLVYYDEQLYAMHMNTSSEIAEDRYFQVYVSVLQCDGTWKRTNQGNSLNILEKGVHSAVNSQMRLIIYNNELFAFWQESAPGGNVMHVKKYDKYADLWERAGEEDPLGLSAFYVTNPNNQNHWAYFYFGGAAVCNNKLYVVWSQKLGDGDREVAVMRFDGSIWTKMNAFNDPVRPGWGQRWITLQSHNGELYLAASEAHPDNTKKAYLKVYRYDDCNDEWSNASETLSIDPRDHPETPSMVSMNGTLYITWREINTSSDEYPAFPYKVYVKAYQGGTSWEFVGDNPVASNMAYNPLLLDYKCRLTLVYGDDINAYIKQYDCENWVDFPGEVPFVSNIIRVGKWPRLSVYSAISENNKIYFAWRKKGDADHYFCGYMDY